MVISSLYLAFVVFLPQPYNNRIELPAEKQKPVYVWYDESKGNEYD